MQRDRWAKLEDAFHEAVRVPSEQRTAFARRRFPNDPTLARELVDLARAHDGDGDRDGAFLAPLDIGSRLDTPAPVDEPPAPTPGAGDRLGGYRLLRELGAGGMGVVFEAEQDRPRRTVALKVLSGMAVSARVRRRFEFEAEILARLQHPGIAQVYEAGVHDPPDGSPSAPYFAMELVADAASITEHADRRAMDHRARLELFLQACDAVAHGHRRGVIHRDLKPGNILVGADGRVKIIDFGIARLSRDAGERGEPITVGGPIGTPDYMAPEQLTGAPSDVDLRCDVYALGVVLYELLVGRRPIETAGLPLLEVARLIGTRPPTPIGRLDRRLRGDPEVVVGRALAKDPEARYQSVHALREDVRRVLRREPVRATRQPLRRELMGLMRRRRGAAVAVLAVGLGLCLAIAGVAAGYVRAVESREDALDMARRADRAAAFLRSVLTDTNPKAGAPMTGVEMLDRAAARVGDELSDEPWVELEVRDSLGHAYWTAGVFDRAEAQLARAYALQLQLRPDDDAEIICAASSLAELRYYMGDLRGALGVLGPVAAERELSTETLKMFVTLAKLQAACGAMEPTRATSDRLVAFAETAGAPCGAIAEALEGLAAARGSTGDVDGAIELLGRAVEVRGKIAGREAAQRLAACLASRASWLMQRRTSDDLRLAGELLDHAVGICDRIEATGFDPIWLDRQRGNLAIVMDQPGRAERIYRSVLPRVTELLGPDHIETGVSRLALARAWRAQGDDAWEDEARAAIEIIAGRLGDAHARVVEARAEFFPEAS